MRSALTVIGVVLLAADSGSMLLAAPPNNYPAGNPGYYNGNPGYAPVVPQPVRPTYTPTPYYRPPASQPVRPTIPNTTFTRPTTFPRPSTVTSTSTGTTTTSNSTGTATNTTSSTNPNNTTNNNPAYPYGYPYGYDYYGSPSYGSPYYGDPYGGSSGYGYYNGPIFVPADSIFGPQAAQQFMGGGLGNAPSGGGLVKSSDFGNGGGGARPVASDPKPAPVHNADPDPVATAQRIIGLGDSLFANQKYLEAFQRYKRAWETAPNLAEADFRQGIALIALGRYEPAAKAIKRGLDRDPKWPSSGLTLDDLYRSNRLGKLAHLENLAKAAERDSDNADLMFLVGVCLHFDGSPDRAALFFQRATQLVGAEPYLKAFQDAPKPAPKVAREEPEDDQL